MSIVVSSPQISFTERHLQALWLEQKYFRGLSSPGDDIIDILSPGSWNVKAGPDFLRAHLRINGVLIRGDIEVHLHEEMWYHHGHNNDSRYDDVILHLCLWNPNKHRDLYTHKGSKIFTVYLEDFMTIPLARIVKLIDLDLYPYKKFLGSGKCASKIFNRLPNEELSSLMTSEAYRRLKKKREHLRAYVDDKLFVAAGIVMALGYKNNTTAFLDLFLWLRGLSGHNEKELLALAIGATGFFEKAYVDMWEASPYYRSLQTLWEDLKDKDFPVFSMTTAQIRPLNHPIRRFVTLVKIINDKTLPDRYNAIEELWDNHWQCCFKKKTRAHLRDTLVSILPNYNDPYWNTHYIFEEKKSSKHIPLTGNVLCKTIFINTILPLLEEHIQKKHGSDELRALTLLYRSFSSSSSRKTLYIRHRFFGDKDKTIIKNACIEQGAYQIYNDNCIHYEASCEGCPFIEKALSTH